MPLNAGVAVRLTPVENLENSSSRPEPLELGASVPFSPVLRCSAHQKPGLSFGDDLIFDIAKPWLALQICRCRREFATWCIVVVAVSV